MKVRVTKKAVRECFDNVISVSAYNLQHLLSSKSPYGYTARAEGWGADIYDCGTVAIVTGYDPFGNVRPPYELQMKYDEKARAIRNNYDLGWQEQDGKIKELLEDFITEALTESKRRKRK